MNILSNQYKNKFNNKETSNELKDILGKDNRISLRTVDILSELDIIKLRGDCKIFELYDDRINTFIESTFNLEQFKNRVREKLE